MFKSFKVKIFPDKNQAEKIIKFCNAARYAYNWAIAYEEEIYKNCGKFITYFELATIWVQFKKLPENEWLKEISGRATRGGVLDATQAYKNFFDKHTDHPKFKKKKYSKMSCATHEANISFTDSHVKLEKLGWLKLGQKNYIPYEKGLKYINPKIEWDKVNYWISVTMDITDKTLNDNKPKTDGIGIDLGIKTLATCSNGIINKKPDISKLQKKLKRLQRKASKLYLPIINESKRKNIKFDCLPKSKNLLKLEVDINKIYQRIKNILTTNIHTFTSGLVNSNPEFICIEDLNVSGLRKNKHLSKKINEAKFYEIRRQLEYKCSWNNIPLIIADRWFPSSKLCSNCGCVKDRLSLSERTYECSDCGFIIERDYNASINLREYGRNQLKLL